MLIDYGPCIWVSLKPTISTIWMWLIAVDLHVWTYTGSLLCQAMWCRLIWILMDCPANPNRKWNLSPKPTWSMPICLVPLVACPPNDKHALDTGQMQSVDLGSLQWLSISYCLIRCLCVLGGCHLYLVPLTGSWLLMKIAPGLFTLSPDQRFSRKVTMLHGEILEPSVTWYWHGLTRLTVFIRVSQCIQTECKNL